MDAEEAVSFAKALSNKLSRAYGLQYQFDAVELEDIAQQALVSWWEARRSGKSEKVAAFRGAHEHIRHIVYGGKDKRCKRIESVEYKDYAMDSRPIENMVDAERIMLRFKVSSDAWRYYREDDDLHTIGMDRGVSESAVCQRVKLQLYAATVGWRALAT